MLTRRSRVAARLGTVAAVLAATVVTGAAVTNAAFPGETYETDFEIDGNLTSDGDTDWDNATANGVQDVTSSVGSELCSVTETGIPDPDDGSVTSDETTRIKQGTKLDDIVVGADLSSIIESAPVPIKADLCKVTLGWQLVEVGTTYQFVLYGSWSRPYVNGEINVLIPLLGDDAGSNDDDVVLSYDFDDNTNDTTVEALTWNTTTEEWEPEALPLGSVDAYTGQQQTDVEVGDGELTIGEFAVNLTAAGFLPEGGPCTSFAAGPILSRTGNDASATLKDVVGALPITLSNCGTINIVKEAIPTPADETPFGWLVQQGDSEAAYDDGTLTVPGEGDHVSVQVPISPDWYVAETDIPSGWWLDSLVCAGVDPLSGEDFTIDVKPYDDWELEGWIQPTFPVGPGSEVTCTIVNVGPPTLTLAKVTEGGFGGPFTLQADITHLQVPEVAAVAGAADDTIVDVFTTVAADTPVSNSHELQSGDLVSVSETDLPAGWKLDDLVCTRTGLEWDVEASEGTEIDPSEFVVSNGDAVVCTATNVPTAADLGVKKFVDGDDANTAPGPKVDPGQAITYTIKVTNTGPAAATNAVVEDAIPANLTDVAVVDDGPYTCDIAAGTLTCTIASHPVGVEATITLSAKVSASAPGGMVITNTATVSSESPDTNPSNNSDPAVITVKSADLAVTKVPDGRQLTSGETFDWTITVTNLGPDAATNAKVVDVLPAALSASTIVDDGPYTCAITAGTMTCTIASHPVGVTATITLRSTAPVASSSGAITITNTATVSSDTPDPNLANNSDPGSVIVPQQASAPPPPTPEPTVLPATGGDPHVALRLGALLALAGAAAVLIGRRRRSA